MYAVILAFLFNVAESAKTIFIAIRKLYDIENICTGISVTLVFDI